MTNVRSAHVTTRMTCILGMAFAFALFVQVTHAQNYHFSNGWHPGGKKRSSTTIDSSSTADSADILCAFRPDLVDVINKLIQVGHNYWSGLGYYLNLTYAFNRKYSHTITTTFHRNSKDRPPQDGLNGL